MTDSEEKAFLAGIKVGLGLSKASELIGKTPKEVSHYLRNDPEFLTQCVDGVSYAAKVLMVISGEHLEKRKFGKWKDNTDHIKKFINQVVLWESYCTKKDVNDGRIMDALMTYNDKREAATAMGMTLAEINSKIIRNPFLQEFMTQNGIPTV